ncbi:MAG: hypothetical protein KatS3mg110_1804 [Pirellulaceae bacterium]|nr:MAG: hypothetical protein KatS3mg110_1804 [Pirellulaceae bacterium]
MTMVAPYTFPQVGNPEELTQPLSSFYDASPDWLLAIQHAW